MAPGVAVQDAISPFPYEEVAERGQRSSHGAAEPQGVRRSTGAGWPGLAPAPARAEGVMAHIDLTLLGHFRASLKSGPTIRVPTRKAQGLLAFMALPSGRAHPRDKLAALLWGNMCDEHA